MDFAEAVQHSEAPPMPTSAPAAPAAPAAEPSAGGSAATPNPMDRINQLFQAPPAPQGGEQPQQNQAAPTAPPAPQPTQQEQFQQQLMQENARLREMMAGSAQQSQETQKALMETTAAIKRMAEIQQNPTLTPEQQKAAIDAEFAELQGNSPKAVIQKWMSPELQALQEKVKALQEQFSKVEPAIQKVDRFSVRDENFARLRQAGHTEMADPNFVLSMLHADNVAEVQKQFYSHVQDAGQIYNDPGFYNALLQNARIRASKGFTAATAQTQAVMQQQAAVAQAGNGMTSAGTPAGQAAGAAPAPTPEQAFKQSLLGKNQSFGQLMAGATFKQA